LPHFQFDLSHDVNGVQSNRDYGQAELHSKYQVPGCIRIRERVDQDIGIKRAEQRIRGYLNRPYREIVKHFIGSEHQTNESY
jgi:hypothetical protein